MIPVLRVTLTILLQLIICHSGVSSLKVTISPKNPLFRLGDSQKLTCRVSQCSGGATFLWGSLEDKPLYADPQSSSSESTLLFKRLTKYHENKFVCTGTCKGANKQASTTVRVYSFAKDPVISGYKNLVSGEKSTLTCEISDVYPAERMALEWVRGGEVVHREEGEYGEESIQSKYKFTPEITNNNESITCRVTLSLEGLPEAESTRETTVSMTVLSFAKDPVISGYKNLVSREKSTLTCEISDVYPAERMALEWVRGGEVVHREAGEYDKKFIQSNYNFTPEITNNNESITCRVTLSLDGLPEAESTRETTVSMTVLCPPVNTLISVSPKNPKENEFFNISCVSDSSPVGHMVLSKVLDENETELVSGEGPQVSVSYSKANFRHTGLYTCTTINLCGRKTDNITVIVSAFTKDPVISGYKNLVSGEKSTLTCEISDVYPAERMALEWVRGGEVVHREAGEYGKKFIQSNYKFTPEITNNNESITCRVTLSLDGLPEAESTRETTVSMTVLFLPKVSSLKVTISPKNPLFRLGDSQKLTCRVSQCSGGATFLWGSLEDKPLYADPQSSSSESTLLFKRLTKYHENKFVCTGTCKGANKQASTTVRVYSFAKDPVISGYKNLVSGEKSTLTCEISDVYPAERMALEWVRGGEVVHREEGEYGEESIQSKYNFTSEITNNNESITCRVTLSLDGLPEAESTRETTVSMTVLSFSSDPTIKNSGLFLEGQVTNLTCTVLEVFPAGSFELQWLYEERVLNLVRGNSSDKPQNLSLTIPFKPKDTDRNKTFTCVVSLEMEGLSRKKTVSTTKTVQYSPRNTTIDVRPHKKPSEGENVTISCQTYSSPEGHVTLKRELNGEEIELVSSNGAQTSFTISFTTVSHSGNYICEAVNKYGHQRKDVQITVQ
ncbi:vascular cell adhesion protein 1, partial [Clarias magur]